MCAQTAQATSWSVNWRWYHHSAELEEVFSSDIAGVLRGEHYTTYKTSADRQGLDGTQIWVRHDLAKLVTESVPICPRMLRITLCLQGAVVHIISAHAPTDVPI